MFEFSGLFEWLRNLVYANAIQDAVGMTAEEKRASWIEYFLDKASDLIFGFLDNCSDAFIHIGNKIIGYFTFNLTDNLFVIIIGFIFGFWIFKFVLNKAVDFTSRIIDIA